MPNTPTLTAEEAVAAERDRCLALIGLCSESAVSPAIVNAIRSGETQEAYAIGLVQRARGGDSATRALGLAAETGHPAVPRRTR